MKKELLLTVLLYSCLLNAQNLRIGNSTRIQTTGNVQIVLHNVSASNNGSSNFANSSLVIRGSANFQLNGDSNWHVRKLLMKKAGGRLALGTSLLVDEKIKFNGGKLDLNGRTITLLPGGFLENESEQSRIVGDNGGYVETVINLNAPTSVNPGNLGAVITSSHNLGNTIVRRRHNLPPSLANAVFRTYEIIPANNSALNATLRFQYFNAELNGNNEQALNLWKATGSNWQSAGATSRDTTLNYVEKTVLSSLAKYTLAATASLLPEKINSGNEVKVSVFPNPVTTVANISLLAVDESDVEISLLDANGKLLQVQRNKLAAGVNAVSIPMFRYSNGSYFLRVKSSAFEKTFSLIKN